MRAGVDLPELRKGEMSGSEHCRGAWGVIEDRHGGICVDAFFMAACDHGGHDGPCDP